MTSAVLARGQPVKWRRCYPHRTSWGCGGNGARDVMKNNENDRDNLDQLIAAEVERLEALSRLLKENRANDRELKWRKPWSEGCVCVRDPTEHLHRSLARLHRGRANEDMVGWVRRWVIAVLQLSVFAGVAAGITYAAYRMVE